MRLKGEYVSSLVTYEHKQTEYVKILYNTCDVAGTTKNMLKFDRSVISVYKTRIDMMLCSDGNSNE
jgi:hypothetical protein